MSEARRGVAAVELSPVGDLPQEFAGVEPVAFGIGPDRAVYVVFDATPSLVGWILHRTARPRGARNPPYAYRVLAYADGECRLDVTLAGVPFVVHHVQPLGDHLLLACARSWYRPDGASDRNARLYTHGGEFVREFLFGDGTQDIQTTSTGDIWTSYFDEGVLGNYGWRHPIGSAGLIAWSADGERMYDYEAPAGHDPIIDCYALNVASKDDVWLYYYGDFPLVRLQHRQPVAIWPDIPVRGADAFAVDGNHALFRGGYAERDICRLIELRTDGKLGRVAKLEPYNERGDPIGTRRVAARADVLMLLSADRIYAFRIRDALAASRPMRSGRSR